MNIEIKILGTKQAMNIWTLAEAVVDGRTYKIQMVRFDEPSKYGVRRGRIRGGAGAERSAGRGGDVLGRCSGTRRREGASRRRELGLRVPGDVHDADLAGGADSSDVAALDGVWGDAALR